MNVINFYKLLSDPSRLKILLLLQQEELCVCELMHALEESQPKVSRNLSELKKGKLVIDRKSAQWVFYKLNPDLESWIKNVITETGKFNSQLTSTPLSRLDKMENRPNKF
ncbi:metalloregulator ArsR/SmtB family transcription factor [Providencia sp. CRE-3FA-0001]|uniref:Metalloregulator ArsR/SmtB family transcription factor n=1 Tax=Providencia huashanensis TaxID=3037798 RepID=A0AA42FGG3_9GAMM|nr:metalloregulator ArsR/SmtB family transcription factor [Providencia sp. CRE-3FA-0001]MDG4696178.1 metalloregulator ArsR/SmtB family transcription factor [Providencia sp. CRE-3FA-0001]